MSYQCIGELLLMQRYKLLRFDSVSAWYFKGSFKRLRYKFMFVWE